MTKVNRDTKPNGWEELREIFFRKFCYPRCIGDKSEHGWYSEKSSNPDKVWRWFELELSQAILSAEERGREEERERILDDGNLWFKTHFTPEDEDTGLFEGIQEYMSQEEFEKVVSLSLPDQEQLSNSKTDE